MASRRAPLSDGMCSGAEILVDICERRPHCAPAVVATNRPRSDLHTDHVPTYTGMVIASGHSHIGFHTDGYGKGKDRVEVLGAVGVENSVAG